MYERHYARITILDSLNVTRLTEILVVRYQGFEMEPVSDGHYGIRSGESSARTCGRS
ncbi:hypothetical protein LCGC14_1042960 [marine sediment metagenome]|uniref:Uncharacterized protein n=1 Tax=marine sediment metagenome TaxID=412755 RepID=A0A0F9QXF7_9ZZZZ